MSTASTALLSAVMNAAACRQVTQVLRFCRPADVALLDAPTAAALDVALELAAEGRQPGAVVLNAELLRRGAYEGHHGDLLRSRVLDAASPAEPPERLPEFASAVLGAVYRARVLAAGEALTAGAATSSEDDLWTLLEREGRAIRALRDSLAALRKHCGKREEASNV
ncbi:hypothetical protein [Gordonia iterans]